MIPTIENSALHKAGVFLLGLVLFCPGQENSMGGDFDIRLPVDSDSLIAYYPLDVDARDYSGNGLHGTVYGAKPFTDRNARPNPAMYFDGKDDYIDLGNSKKFKPDFPITVALWFKSEREYGQNIFTNNYDEDYYNGINVGFIRHDYAKPKAEYGNGGLTTKFGRKTYTADFHVKESKWYHITAIYHGRDSIQIYMDGKLIRGSYSGFASNMSYTDGPARIGTKDGNYDAPPWYFKGAVDELFLFQRVLSVDEIRKLMNFTHKPFSAMPATR